MYMVCIYDIYMYVTHMWDLYTGICAYVCGVYTCSCTCMSTLATEYMWQPEDTLCFIPYFLLPFGQDVSLLLLTTVYTIDPFNLLWVLPSLSLISYVNIGALRLQIRATMLSFMWILDIQTQIFMFVWVT